MMVLKARGRPPYGGEYVVKDRLTSQEFRGTHFEMLYNRIVAARKANGFPVGLAFEAEVEQWVCEDHPQECREHNPAIPRQPREIAMGALLQGTKVMLAHWLAGRPIVSKEEATRRASICIKCRYNVPFRMPCSGWCGELLSIVERVIGGATTPHDQELKSCFICNCHLKPAVWTELDIQCKGVDEAMKKQFASVPHCWKQCP